jgi:hypothetical protein
MAPEELVEATRQRPFEPFRIHVSDGSAYDVRHPDQCMTLRRVVIVAAPADPSQPVPDRAVRVDVLHITRLEPLAAAAPPGGNGAAG